MILKQVTIDSIYSHVKKGSEKLLTPGVTYGKQWCVVTPAADQGTNLTKTRLFKSAVSNLKCNTTV